LVPNKKMKDLLSEADQLVAIFNASRATAKKASHSTINNQNSTMANKKVS
jgi:hypothetical protein